MKKDEDLLLLKAKLAEVLEKNGSSLLEFEDELEKMAKSPGEIVGDVTGDAIKGGAGIVGSIFSQLPEWAFTGALLAGTTGGGALYAANRHLNSQDKALDEKRQEVERYKQLTDRIKTDYHL